MRVENVHQCRAAFRLVQRNEPALRREIGLGCFTCNARRRVVGGEELALRQQLVLELADRTLRRPERSAPAFKEDFEEVWGAVDKYVAIAILVTPVELQ